MMKRHYCNFTDNPIHYKVWGIAKTDWNTSDFLWLSSLDIKVHIDQPTHEFQTASGGCHTVAGKPRVELETTTKKQESMLYLKYSDTIFLLSEVTVLPSSVMSI